MMQRESTTLAPHVPTLRRTPLGIATASFVHQPHLPCLQRTSRHRAEPRLRMSNCLRPSQAPTLACHPPPFPPPCPLPPSPSPYVSPISIDAAREAPASGPGLRSLSNFPSTRFADFGYARMSLDPKLPTGNCPEWCVQPRMACPPSSGDIHVCITSTLNPPNSLQECICA